MATLNSNVQSVRDDSNNEEKHMRNIISSISVLLCLTVFPAVGQGQDLSDFQLDPFDQFYDQIQRNPPNAFSACNQQYIYQRKSVVNCEFGIINYCEAEKEGAVKTCIKSCEQLSSGSSVETTCHYGCYAAHTYGGCEGLR